MAGGGRSHDYLDGLQPLVEDLCNETGWSRDEAWARFRDLLAQLERERVPNTFAGDVTVVMNLTGWQRGHGGARKHLEVPEVSQAIERLRRRLFSRSALFDGRRWRALAKPFSDYRRESGDISSSEGWARLVRESLCLAIAASERGFEAAGKWYPSLRALPAEMWYPFLRRRVRAEVERALLHGATSDEAEATPPSDWPDAGIADAAQPEFEDAHLEAMWALAALTPKERDALLAHYVRRESDDTVAARDGVAAATVRDRRRRAVTKLKRHLV